MCSSDLASTQSASYVLDLGTTRENQFFFEGKLNIPEVLKKRSIASPTISVNVGAFSDMTSSKVIVTFPKQATTMPAKFRIPVPIETLESWAKLNPSKKLLFIFTYYYDPTDSAPEKNTLGGRIAGRTIIDSTKINFSAKSLDIGEISFSFDAPYGRPRANPNIPCAPDSSIRGKIIATPAFMSSIKPGQKFAYFFHNDMINIYSSAGLPATISEIFSEGFFEPSNQGASFEIPMNRFKIPSYFVGHAVACGANESLENCRGRAALFSMFPNNADYTNFLLIPKGLLFPHCALPGDHIFYLHRFPPIADKSKWISEPGKNLPPEILEGQYY